MKETIKIKLSKSPTEQHCKRCRWLYKSSFEPECLLYMEQLETDRQNNKVMRCQLCKKSQFTDDNKRYLKYEIELQNYDTCGNCPLQYFNQLENSKEEYGSITGGYRICPIFKKPITFESGLNSEGDDWYEDHYRCTSCHSAVI